MTEFPDSIPAWHRAIWDGHNLLNRGQAPLWSGQGDPPAIGSTVSLAGPRDLSVTIHGYKIQDGWLMAVGVRCDGKEGDLAGAEIRYPAQEA